MTEDFVGFLVVGVADVGDSDENFKGILVIWFTDAALDIALDFCFSFFTMSVERC